MSLRVVEAREAREAVSPFPERDLILAAQGGETAAFKELYEHYRDRVYSLIQYSLNDAQQAEDVLQNVFVKVFQALIFFRLESCFLTWVYRVAINECKNANRRRRLFVPIHAAGRGIVADRDGQPDAVHASRQLSGLLQEAVRQLKPKYRIVILLKYVEEMSYEEIARTLGCSTGTVASRLSRALEVLHNRLRSFV